MTFDVVILGSAGTHPSRDRVCSGLLFRTDGTNLLVDCGHGSTHVLQQFCALDEIDAVLITHRHADHCVDLVGTYYALRFHESGQRAVDVYAPSGTGEMLAGLVGDSHETFRDVCRFRDVVPGDHLDIGDLSIDLYDANHAVPTVAVRAEHGGLVATYSSDSGGSDDLVRAARDADLFVCEASWLGDQHDHPPGLHLTAGEAARTATAAGARRLVLTHIWPANDLSQTEAEAAAEYDGPLSIAEDGQVLAVGEEA